MKNSKEPQEPKSEPQEDELHEAWQALGHPAAPTTDPVALQAEQERTSLRALTEALRALATLGPDDGGPSHCYIRLTVQIPNDRTAWTSRAHTNIEDALHEASEYLSLSVRQALSQAQHHLQISTEEARRCRRQVKALAASQDSLPVPTPRPEPEFVREPDFDDLPF